MKKQLLFLVMILLPLVVSAHDIEVKNTDNVAIYYNYINDDTELEVTFAGTHYLMDYEYMGKVVIPEEVIIENKTYKVTSIGNNAFRECTELTSVTIPNSVTKIGNHAFDLCYALNSITIGNSVASFGDYVFQKCSGLTSITIPNSMMSIGGGAFSGCSGLQKVIVSDIATWYGIKFSSNDANPLYYAKHLYNDENTEIKDLVIPNSVTSIGNYTFVGCIGLTSVTIPNSVTSIGDHAFERCAGLTSVTIPESIPYLGERAFFGCTDLTSVTINSNSIVSKNYSSNSNLQTIFGKQVEEYIIGDGVTSIGKYAFYGCTGLNSVTIPSSVTSIGDYAFENCTDMTFVTINSNSIVSKDYSYDSNLLNIFGEHVKSYIIGDGVTSIGKYAFYMCTGLTSVTIPSSVTGIGDYAFLGCTGLTSVNIPKGVPCIGDRAFHDCTSLTSVTINSNSIVSKDYSYDSNLLNIFGEHVKSYIIGDSVTSIGKYAFYSCKGLAAVTIPSSITNIGDFAFADCAGLTSVTIPSCVYSIGNYAFRGCTGLSSVTIPEGIICIEQHTFSGCTGLTSVAIPSSVTSIGSYAFSSCTRLSSVTIPSSVTSIGRGAFSGCTGLSSVHIIDLAAWCKITFENNPLYDAHHLYLNGEEIIDLVIPSSVTNIRNSAFSGCTGLTSVTIPSSVTSIEESAFDGCTGLTSVTISDGVISIGERAFAYCKGLTYVVIPSSVTNIENEAFWYCKGLTSVTIGNSVTNIGFGAFDGADITTVFSQIENPFTIFGKTSVDRTFTLNTFNNAMLYVPSGTIDKYKATDGWKDFENIVEDVPAGINAIENAKNNNTTIYDLNGVRQPEPKKGINIVNGKKLVVK